MSAGGAHASIVLALAEVAADDERWESFRPGIEIRHVYGTPGVGAAAAILRYAPGAILQRHEHTGYEHILVISGEQRDERGSYGPGTFIVNPPESGHDVSSPLGCVVLVIWQSPVRF